MGVADPGVEAAQPEAAEVLGPPACLICVRVEDIDLEASLSAVAVFS